MYIGLFILKGSIKNSISADFNNIIHNYENLENYIFIEMELECFTLLDPDALFLYLSARFRKILPKVRVSVVSSPVLEVLIRWFFNMIRFLKHHKLIWIIFV